jgi:pSer/pThr/pTyr-binding forkhead associated (FHA) protein
MQCFRGYVFIIAMSTFEKPGDIYRLALVFVTGPEAGHEKLLAEGEELVVGRSKDAHVVINDTKTSRRHARFHFSGGDLHVEDLGSFNGTFVNGAKVERRVLMPGDSVEVGNVRIKVERRTQAVAGNHPPLTGQRAEAPAIVSTMGNVLSDTLTPAKLREMLRFLSERSKTGAMIVHASWGTGKIYFRHGQVYHADLTGAPAISPLKAIQRLLRAQTGTMEFSAEDPIKITPELNVSLESLLGEDDSFTQEVSRLEKWLPVPDARLKVTTPAGKSAADLTPSEQVIVKLAGEQGTLSHVLDHFPGTDTDAIRILIRLASQGWIHFSK